MSSNKKTKEELLLELEYYKAQCNILRDTANAILACGKLSVPGKLIEEALKKIRELNNEWRKKLKGE